ncbi:hypothetical protein R21Y_69 [Vibrio phage vB_VhaS_R21Y]|nr:hypothetical protein R21Y_69 [Vibrio phage vB_VhaS_R21Y]
MATFNFETFYFVQANQLTADFTSRYSVAERLTADFESTYNAVQARVFNFETSYSVRPIGERVADFGTSYLVTDPYIAPSVPETITISVAGQPIDFDTVTGQLSIAINTSGVGYTCSFISHDLPEVLGIGDTIEINVGGLIYNFIFDRLQEEENGLEASTRTVSGVSPLQVFGSPRAIAIDFTNETPRLASDIVRGLLGSVTWEIVDWVIPEFRLAVTQQTPLQIAQSVVEAAGGILTSDRLGNAVAKYRYPVSTNDYQTTTPDQIYNTFDHVFSRRQSLDPKTGFNNFLVTDVAQGTQGTRFSDVLDFDLSSRSSATITAYLSPVRDVVLQHTAPESLTIETIGERLMLEQVEDVEIRNGEGQTRRPIASITAMDFISLPLTGVAYEPGASLLTTADPNAFGLVRVTYNTIANQYRVNGVTSSKVQFLLKEA